MSDDRLQFWFDYLCDLARRMKLNDWHFRLTDEPCEPDAHGKITPTPGRYRATVQLAWDFERLDPEEQRHVLVHELIHAHLEPAEQVLWQVREMQDDSYQHIVHIYRSQIEYSVDQIAAVLAPFMPLPEFTQAEAEV